MGIYAGLIRWVGSQRWLLPAATLVGPIERVFLKRFGRRITPFPTLLLTTTGRITGKKVDAPLYYLRDESELAVIASNFGRQEPDWSLNLRADPLCEVQIRRATNSYRARLSDGRVWDGYLERFAEFYPTYLDYIARAGREVPIWVLDPVSASTNDS